MPENNPTFAVRLLSGVAATAILMSAGVARAADAAPEQVATEDSGGLAEIIVTARKVSEKLQDVPVAVTAFSGAQLQAQNAVKVSEIAAFTPGFTTVEGSSNPTALLLSIRGQVQNDALATLEPSVGTYVDGIYIARSYGLNGDLLDIANVQVLKGPQGTLFGRNTSAGAVLIETNKPHLDKISGSVTATYGRFNEFDGTAVINLPLVVDKFAVRGAIKVRRRDGYMINAGTGQKFDNIDNVTGRVKALWQVADNISLLGSAEWYSFKSKGPSRQARLVTGTALTYEQLASTQFGAVAGIAPDNVAEALNQATHPDASQIGALYGDPRNVSLNDVPLTDTKTQSYGLTAQVDMGDATLKLIGGYRKITSSSNIDLDGTPYLILQTTGYQDLHQWSGEVQLTGKALDGKLDYATGATYFTEGGFDRSTSNNAVGFVPFLAFVGALAPAGIPAGTYVPNTTARYRGDIDNKSFGVYAQASYHVTDALTFTAGLRWSSDKKSLLTHNGNSLFNQTAYINCAIPAIATVADDNCAAGRSDVFRRLSYTVGVDYKITPDVLIYAKAGRGYRSGGENLRANGDPATFAPFKPEVNDEQEIGIKSEFLDHKVRLNVAAYHNQISDAQRSLLLNVPGSTTLLTVLYNAQKQQTWGAEAELAVVVAPFLTVSASGSITDPKYKEYTQPIAFGSSTYVDHSGDAFVAVPKHSFTVAADFHQRVGSGKLTARIDYAWSDKYYGSPDLLKYAGTTITPNSAADIASFTTPASGVLGGNVGYECDMGLSVVVWGKNLTDNRAYVQNLYVGPLGISAGKRRDPVTYGVTVGYHF
ncbi:TonB-dependent receptor [Novosphingobium sp. KCTC 2891]|uniref:TonB-dependent receptor n=1 Tax=unclassified Novosphingobium TaxID=2644732 RepID=UPI00222259AF|nr:TonB-dependent receptor [Novosphingobium sp. KCTC 2891]MCW1384764.1 TonB-dependent receptor [Novosphingobium sp. KCTC 2891]